MHAGRNNLYDAAIRRMVKDSLEEKESTFRQEHQNDSDEELLCYLRQCAAQLGHSPHAKEIIGWEFINERFETWTCALARAGLPMPSTPNKPTQFLLFINEEKEQQRIYRERKAEKKRRALIRQAERENKEKESTLSKKNNRKKTNSEGITEDTL